MMEKDRYINCKLCKRSAILEDDVVIRFAQPNGNGGEVNWIHDYNEFPKECKDATGSGLCAVDNAAPTSDT